MAYAAVLAVPRLNGSAPDAIREFFERFHNRQPVVIEGVLGAWPAMRWSAEALAARCPAARLPVYKYEQAASDWAGLRDAGQPLLAEYLRGEFGKRGDVAAAEEVRYGLEMSLRNECPRLLEDVRIPAYFVDDLLVRHYKKAAWPTLIAGPRGTRSGLHRDTHDLPFWMALFVGRKRWRIFRPDDPDVSAYYQADRNGFVFDAFAPDFARHPRLGAAEVYEHVLEAGQLLYIPSGAPHAAFNLEDTIAISGNYLDPRGLARHAQRTCQQDLWRESKLCWLHTAEFERSEPAPLEDLHERSYFEFAGFKGPAEWCQAFQPELAERAERLPELRRCVEIVEGYCAAKRAD